MTVSAVVPVPASERIASIDVLRGVAVLGILVMNIVSFGLPWAAYGDPTVAGGAAGADLAVWFLGQMFVEGKMRAVFSMLFGAGAVLLTGRAEARGAAVGSADIYYRRTLWLIVFGLLHAWFLWSGDILYGYGVAGLFLYPFRRQAPSFLITAGALVLAVLVPLNIVEARRIGDLRARADQVESDAAAGRALSQEESKVVDEWREELEAMKPPADEIAREIADHRAGYWRTFERRVEHIMGKESSGYYKFGFFDAAGMMLIGMALLKLDIFSARRSRRFYSLMALAGYGAGLPLTLYVTWHDKAHGFDPVQTYYGYTGYDLARLCVALGHIAVVMLICKAGILRRLTARLAAAGRMALSNYLGASVACVLFFDGVGLGMFGRLGRAQLLYVVLGVWVLQLLLSPIWLRHFRFGPMEWLWRSLTHWRRQPMRVAPSGTPVPVPPAA